MRIKSKVIICAILSLFIVDFISAQVWNIADGGNVSTCDTTIVDNGGETGMYSPNMNNLITICPDGEGGSSIQITFDSLDIHQSDTLKIYNGSDVNSPLMIAVNNSNTVNNAVFFATNTTGCITFEFISDGANEGGGFDIKISCTTPCQTSAPEISSVESESPIGPDGYIDICRGQEVVFTGNGTFPQSGNQTPTSPGYTQHNDSCTFHWDFGDGIEVENQRIVSHTFNQPIGVIVKLTVTDQKGCIDIIERKVRVSSPPIFSSIQFEKDTICFESSVALNANSANSINDSLEFQPINGAINTGGIYGQLEYLPDGNGVSYENEINISGFGTGVTLTNPSQLLSIFVNMEHSYSGDLEMSISCPNGQTALLMDGYNGGGMSVFMGEPIDGLPNGVPGIGYDYYFTMSGNQTMVDTYPNLEVTDYVNQLGNEVSNVQILPTGNYLPEESFNNLIGCPIDGNWKIIITDNLGSDDGYIFSWGIFFSPDLNPNAETYNVNVDSIFWSPNSTITSNTNNIIEVLPTETITNYTLNVIDDFGCSYDTTYQIHMLSELIAEIGSDTFVCNNIETSFTPNLEGGCDNIILNLYDTYINNDGWNGNTIDVTINGTTNNYTIENGNNSLNVPLGVSHGDEVILTFNNSGTYGSECEIYLVTDTGDTIYSNGSNGNFPNTNTDSITINCFGGIEFNWSPNSLFNNSSLLTQDITITSDTKISFSLNHVGFPNCFDSDTINLTIQNTPDTGTDSMLNACHDGSSKNLFELIGGNPETGGYWINPSGDTINMPYTPITMDSGIYKYKKNLNGCISSTNITVNEYEITTQNSITDANCGTACNGIIHLVPSGGFGSYKYAANNSPIQVSDSFVNLCPTEYEMVILDELGCRDTLNLTVSEINHPKIISIDTTGVTCFGANDGKAIINTNNVINYTLVGVSNQTSNMFSGLEPKTHTITVDNGFGCDTTATFVITEPDSLYFTFFSSDTSQCIGTPVSANVQVNGGSSSYFYEWTLNENEIVSNSKELSLPSSPVGGGRYCLNVKEECISTQIDTCFTLNNHANIYPMIKDSTDGCYPVEAIFENISFNGDKIATVNWNFGDVGSTTTTTGINQTSYTYNTPGVYNVSLNIESIYGCKYDTVFVNYVKIYDYPEASFINEPISPTMFNTTSDFESTSSSDVVAWEWDFSSNGTPLTSNSENVTVQFTDGQFGDYPVTLWVTNSDGCRDSITKIITVKSEVLIFVPNTFTPDNDSFNEEWKINFIGVDFSTYNIKVHNRWGEKVWESIDVNEGWNGTYKNQLVPDGTYVWEINARDFETDEKLVYKGTITVLR